MLKDPETAAMYLEEILAEGDIELFKAALKDVAAARVGNMTALARETHLAHEALYRSLSRKGTTPGHLDKGSSCCRFAPIHYT